MNASPSRIASRSSEVAPRARKDLSYHQPQNTLPPDDATLSMFQNRTSSSVRGMATIHR